VLSDVIREFRKLRFIKEASWIGFGFAEALAGVSERSASMMFRRFPPLHVRAVANLSRGSSILSLAA
jgi:hypothetical protein